jgi:trk system potassium uptake protein TrkA
MYVVIAGESEVAFSIAELLMEQHKVILVGPTPHAAPRLDRLDVELVSGSCTDAGVLEAAHIQNARVFVAATESDEQNLVACIAARRAGAQRTICLLSRPGFVRIAEEDDRLAESLGIDAIVRPSEQLAREILRIVTVPGALDLEHLVGGRVRLLRHAVEPDARLLEAPLRGLELPENVVLVMGRRGDETFIPTGETRFLPGDKVTAVGTPRGVHELRWRFLRGKHHGADVQRATIVGGGVVGFAVAKGLEEAGWTIKLIEASQARCESIAPQLEGVVLHGDGTDMDLLEEERIGDEPVMVAVTSNDEKNLLVSVLARHLGVKRIITRADRLANERIFEKVGIDVVRSARGAAIRTVVRKVVGARADLHAELEHGDMEIIEITLPDGYPDTPVRDLACSLFAIIATVLRGRQVIVPNGRTVLHGGDHLLVFTSKADEDAARVHFLRAPSRAPAGLPPDDATEG